MIVSDQEIDRIACNMIKQHGESAAIAAGKKLNDCIDRADWDGRDVWARIVHSIHKRQASASEAITPGQRSEE